MSATEAATVAAGVVGALGGATGIATVFRARSQNLLDTGAAEKAKAETEAVLVETARGLVSDVRQEMDRKVTDLDREVGRLRGHLESAIAERDHLRQVEQTLRRDNAMLRARIDRLEARVRELTEALTSATAALAAGTTPAPPAPLGA